MTTEPPEFWAFILSNVMLLVAGGTLTVLSFRAYQQTQRSAVRIAVLGFGTITFGTLIEAIYELGIRGTYELSGRELLLLHTVEGVVITLGLALLFYSLRQY